jgi:hypothetical protein
MHLAAHQKKDHPMSHAAALAILPNPALAAVYACQRADVSEPLPKLVHRMLELFDGARTVAAVCASAQIPETQGLAIVRKLSKLGLIGTSAEKTQLAALEMGETMRDLPSSRASFTADEEAFFSSEVQPVDDEFGPTLGEKVSLFVSDLVLRMRGAAL